MKRISRIVFLTVVLVAFGVGTSFAAGTLYNGVNVWNYGFPYSDPVLNVQIAACELIEPTAGYSLPINSPNPDPSTITSGIVFRPGDNIPAIGTLITVNLGNATFDFPTAGYSYGLFVYDDLNNQINLVGTLTSGGPTMDYLTFATTAAIEYDKLVSVLAYTTGTDQGPPLNIYRVQMDYALVCDGPALYADGGDVTVAVSVTGVPTADASPTVFQHYQHQFGINPTSWHQRGAIGVDMIDASAWANRRWFLQPPPMTKVADDAAFLTTNDLTGWDQIVQAEDVLEITLVLTGDFSGIQYPAEDITIGGVPSISGLTGLWDKDAQTLTFEIDPDLIIAMGMWGFGPFHHFEMRVDGATILNTRAWYLSGTVQMEGPPSVTQPGASGQTIELAQTVIGEWQVNGKQFFVPLTRQTDDDHNRSFVRFVNDNTKPAQVFCDVLTNEGNVVSWHLGEILAHDSGQWSATDITTLMGDLDGVNFATRWTLTTQSNNSYANTGKNIYCTAWLTMLTGNTWATRLLNVYENSKLDLSIDMNHGGMNARGTVRVK